MYKVNVRLAYGCRAIGKGSEAAKVFCGVMHLPRPPNRFLTYTEVLGSSTENICFQSMKEEAVVANENVRDIPIAVDGKWQKRGHT